VTDKQAPDDLRYTTEHEWVKKVSDTAVRVGITDYAQDQLGDVVFVQLPAVDDEVVVGVSFAEVESTKSVSDIFGPLAGVVTNVNDRLEASPDLVNSEPYGMGWLVEIDVGAGADLDAVLGEMLDASGYREVTAG
jgi:glycine cleavage system H protein